MSTNYKIMKFKFAPLPEKQYVAQESIITSFLKNDHAKSIYYFILSLFFCLTTTSVMEEYLSTQKMTFGTKIIYAAFKNIHVALAIWLSMFALSQIAFIGLKIWTKILHSYYPKSSERKIWNTFCLTATLCYYLLLLFPTYLIRKTDQPIASSIALMLEEVRFLMKTHAFLRSNIPKILNYKPHIEKTNPMPKYSQFLYFHFAPTLVYKNAYPRSIETRWRHVFKHLIEIIINLFMMCFIVEKFMEPFSDTCLFKFTWKDYVGHFVMGFLPGIALFLCHFYIFQHSWLNCAAELTRFGDRMFYKDWWTSKTYSNYFRTWNLPVYDWLYMYIYKDMYELVAPGKKALAKVVVFMVSALVHEFVASFSLKLFFPVMFVQIMVAVCIISFGKRFRNMGNTIFWFNMEIGISNMFTLYALELYARYNCPGDESSLSYYFVPRVLTCNCYK